MNYRLNRLDASNDGDVNDAWSTGEVLDLPEEPTVHDVCEALKGLDRMASDWPESKVKLSPDENGDVYVLNETGRKIYQLEPES